MIIGIIIVVFMLLSMTVISTASTNERDTCLHKNIFEKMREVGETPTILGFIIELLFLIFLYFFVYLS
jgi:hypothetical protein